MKLLTRNRSSEYGGGVPHYMTKGHVSTPLRGVPRRVVSMGAAMFLSRPLLFISLALLGNGGYGRPYYEGCRQRRFQPLPDAGERYPAFIA